MADAEQRRGASSAEPDLKVRAVAGQFQWSFEYLPADANGDTEPLFTITAPNGPDGGLTLPAGQTTHLYLRSPDVIHAFYVPQFLFKRDVIPGVQDNQFDLDIPATTPARRIAASAPSCAASATGSCCSRSMSLAPADFQAWYDKQVAAANATPPPAPSGARRRTDDQRSPRRASSSIRRP